MPRPSSNASHHPLRALALELRATNPRASKLSNEQKRFKKFVKDIDALRAAITQWREFEPEFRRRLTTEIDPLFARYRDHRVQLVMLLKTAIDDRELGKRQKAKAIEILC